MDKKCSSINSELLHSNKPYNHARDASAKKSQVTNLFFQQEKNNNNMMSIQQYFQLNIYTRKSKFQQQTKLSKILEFFLKKFNISNQFEKFNEKPVKFSESSQWNTQNELHINKVDLKFNTKPTISFSKNKKDIQKYMYLFYLQKTNIQPQLKKFIRLLSHKQDICIISIQQYQVGLWAFINVFLTGPILSIQNMQYPKNHLGIHQTKCNNNMQQQQQQQC
eukprot:TRINITY_DN15824_c1_g1_i2.p1 TRINITY_DN15824_c1_g1~~TRINITY_DN15824_c1_g1_i2.p1  ORF type:complete len:221 (-),score=-4.55 TRINITY_DN15824_c1_g1_i2:28-690(-)